MSRCVSPASSRFWIFIAVGLTPSPPPGRSVPPPPQLDAVIVCFPLPVAAGHTHGWGLWSNAARVGDWPLGSSTKDSWVGAGHSCFPPSATAMVQASPPTAQDDTTNGDNVVPASPAFCAERLGRFFDMIKKKRTSPLFKAPIRLAVQPTPSDTPKHSNSRFANNKLLRFRSPVATKSYSCDAFAWRLVSSIESSTPACQVVMQTR